MADRITAGSSPNAQPSRADIDPRMRALLMSFRQASLMIAAAIESYLGMQKQNI